MRKFGQWRAAIALVLFAAVFIGLSVYSYTRTSATVDEPISLTSGYAMLKYHDYRFSPDHGPFLRMWAAIPLVCMRHVSFHPHVISENDSIDWLFTSQFDASHAFLYEWNDADHLLYAARFMMTLLGIALGILVFCWARELFGYWPAVVALGLYSLDPNILAHGSLITSDSGLGCFVFGAAYFLWRTARRLSPGNLIGLSVFTALALVSKFWGLLLLPMIPLCLASRLTSQTPWPCRIGAVRELVSISTRIWAVIAVSFFVVLTGYLGIWAAYDFRYCPSADESEQFHLEQTDFIQHRAPELAARAGWLDRTHLLPDAYTEGFLFGCATLPGRELFLNGNVSHLGWWYYFPEAFLIKTPVSLLLLLLAGTVLWFRQMRTAWRDSLFVFLPPLVFFGVAMYGHVDIGLRYVVLIYPFVTLIATKAIAECLKFRLQWMPVAAVIIAACELARVYPHCLAYFNCLVGGPSHGYRYLADSNLDWGQDLKGLKQWMDENGVKHINLCYFGTADPAYYHINYTDMFDPAHLVPGQTSPAQFPGYVAISAMYLEKLKPFWNHKPAAVIGYSIYIYWVDKVFPGGPGMTPN
ncbi:MAG: glycosyltransferase family 39 protein [Verrucomicrobiota bacterium]